MTRRWVSINIFQPGYHQKMAPNTSHAKGGFNIDPARVRAVVFDLGGVFLAGGPSEVRAFGGKIGLGQQAWEDIARELFIDGDAWGRVERAEATLDQFGEALREMTAAQGVEISLDTARNFMGSPGDRLSMPVRSEIVDICLRLRKRLPTALLTNNIAEWREGWRRRIDVDALFDVVVDSSDEGMRKPEPGIYRLTEERLGLPGEALLFVDDLGVNLKTAMERGWQTLKYVDTAEVVAALEQVTQAHPER